MIKVFYETSPWNQSYETFKTMKEAEAFVKRLETGGFKNIRIERKA